MKRSPLLPIFLIVVVDVLGLTIILPLLPFYSERLGASPAVVGLLVSSYAFCQLIAGPILGRISDQVGRKPMLIISQVGTLCGFLILSRAETLWLVFLARIIDGLTAGNLSLAQAYIADVTEPKNRARSFGVIGIAFGIGFSLGPFITGFLSQYSQQWPIYAAAGLSFTSIMATTFLLPATPPHPEGQVNEAAGPTPPAGRRLTLLSWGLYAQYFRRPPLAALLLQFFCFAFAFATFTSGFALFAERRLTFHGHPFGAREVGYTFAYAGVLGIILQGGLIGRLVKRFGERTLVTAGLVSAAVGYVLLGGAFGVPLLLLAATISSFGTGVLRPTLTSLITQQVDRREQGVVLGLNQSLQSVAQIIAPSMAGLLINHGLLMGWAGMAAAVIAVGLVINRSRASRSAATA